MKPSFKFRLWAYLIAKEGATVEQIMEFTGQFRYAVIRELNDMLPGAHVYRIEDVWHANPEQPPALVRCKPRKVEASPIATWLSAKPVAV